jgi:hypothetical protein
MRYGYVGMTFTDLERMNKQMNLVSRVVLVMTRRHYYYLLNNRRKSFSVTDKGHMDGVQGRWFSSSM